ncbi:MAG: homoserine dehydrogenase [Candidatus Hydrogenedentota bacterium]
MPIGVGLIGAGTVGGGVIQTLAANREVIRQRTGADVVLRHAVDLAPERFDAFPMDGVTVGTDAMALINDPGVQIVVELIGGLKPAKTFILEALKAKKNVVTANKMLLAHDGPELVHAAKENGVELRFEAAVAGGIPIIKALREGLVSNHIKRIYGILNGTCNYILSRMSYEGLDFDTVLKQAQEKGFAETPPDLDILGHDTAHKCQILASLAFGTEIDLNDVYVEGITGITHADVAYATEMGYVIKLLAIIQGGNGSIEARVHPTLVPEDKLLASVRNEFNAIYVESDIADKTLYYGRGAGRMPTASAVVADIVDIARRDDSPAPVPFNYGPKLPVKDIGDITSQYYLRLTTHDTPGVLGRVCTILGDHGVSIASCIQKDPHGSEYLPVVLMTHETKESALQAAVQQIDGLDSIPELTHMIRVLDDE